MGNGLMVDGYDKFSDENKKLFKLACEKIIHDNGKGPSQIFEIKDIEKNMNIISKL